MTGIAPATPMAPSKEPSTWSRTGASSKESPPASEHLLAMTAAIWHSRATVQPVAVPRLQWGSRGDRVSQ
jgi:hypothetical protein